MTTHLIQSAVLTAENLSIPEKIEKYGIPVFIVGMVTIFAALAVLWGVLTISRLFFYDIPLRKTKVAPIEPIQVPELSDIPLASDSVPAVAAVRTEDLVAVITAAICAYRSNDSSAPALPFRVVSYRKARSAAGWSGINENELI